jgi:hypothetical protein
LAGQANLGEHILDINFVHIFFAVWFQLSRCCCLLAKLEIIIIINITKQKGVL